jgi:prepilin-type N-terminal cleavage/methylation domain-containing protein/prepilin-type processing-associated H-X9-DG protein
LSPAKCRKIAANHAEELEVPDSRSRRAFTLVELLVVIAIIGVLVALLLPAVQSAREAARRVQCVNQLRQVALACLTHENAHRFLPSGGWSKEWTADPDRGIGKRQPGGWTYSVLRFLEEGPLSELGSGETLNSQLHRTAMAQLHQSVISIFYCPSRRAPGLYPIRWASCFNAIAVPDLPGLTKCDYAANAGDGQISSGDPPLFIPTTYAQADSPTARWTNLRDKRNPRLYTTGVIYQRSQVKVGQVKDGTTHVYLAGEKYVNSDVYTGISTFTTFPDLGENQSPYTGFEWDNTRLTSRPTAGLPPTKPLRDTPGLDRNRAFGSSHSSGFNMAMCDGSVTQVTFDIDQEVHRRLGNREDGLPVDIGSQ